MTTPETKMESSGEPSSDGLAYAACGCVFKPDTAENQTQPYAHECQRHAEINARLRAKLAEVLLQLGAWHSVFGTTQLTHAKAKLEAAERERDEWKAKAEFGPVTKLQELAAERDEWRSKALDVEAHPVVVCLRQEADLFRVQRDEARATIERMAEAMRKIGDGNPARNGSAWPTDQEMATIARAALKAAGLSKERGR